MNEIETSTKTKRNTRKSGKLVAKLNQRRLAAEARQQVYSDLTLKQRLARTKTRPGNSTKEVARITKAIEAEKAAVKPKPVTKK